MPKYIKAKNRAIDRKHLICKRCGYEWFTTKEPEHCAKCNSPYWDRERVLPYDDKYENDK